MRTDVSLGRTPDGRRIEVSRVVAAAPGAAWDLLVDTERWPEWGPSVTAVDCPDRRIRRGSTGRVRLPGGLQVPFEVTGFDADRRRWTWRVARVPATGHRVEAVPTGDGGGDDPATERCRVVFEVPVWAGGYVPVCRRALGRIEDALVA